jgi:Tol biopolymer transport system component
LDLQTTARQRLRLFDYGTILRLDWVGRSDKLVVTGGYYAQVTLNKSTLTPGRVVIVDAQTGNMQTILETGALRSARVSPDGFYLALLSEKGYDSQGTFTYEVSFRALNNPAVELVPAFSQGTSGRYSYEATLEDWSQDGTYLVVRSTATRQAGVTAQDVSLVSVVTGKPLQQISTSGYYSTATFIKLGGPFYILKAANQYNGPDAPSTQSFRVENLDGTGKILLFNFQDNELALRLAQLVQVPGIG